MRVARESSAASPLYDRRRHVDIGISRVSNTSSVDYPGHYYGEDNSWDLVKFKQKLQVKVQRLSQRSVEFDLVGVDASIANAFRRIIIAEVPTVAIEDVYVWNNTSVIVDEVFAHRLGLIPLNIDPALIEMKKSNADQATDHNTVVFRLQVTCSRNEKVKDQEMDPSKFYINSEVLSSHLKWEPKGEQASVFANKPPAPMNSNLVIAKLRPGQEVDMELHAVKGVGKDHAKFSPVATASYRLLPLIVLNPQKPVPPQFAEKFQQCFSPGVIHVDPYTKVASVDEKNMRRDAVSREALRHAEFEGCVELKRVRDFFLFSIESEGPYAPQQLFPEAIRVMRGKIANIRQAAEALLDDMEGKLDLDIVNE